MEYGNLNTGRSNRKSLNAKSKSPISPSEKLSREIFGWMCGKDVVRPRLKNIFAQLPKQDQIGQ